MKEIEVTIDKNGEVSLDLKGWHGKGCADVTKQFEKALGTIIKSDKKCDFWKTETKTKQKIRGM